MDSSEPNLNIRFRSRMRTKSSTIFAVSLSSKRPAFRIPQNGKTWEVDQFEKENAGLVIAELETSKDNRSPAHLPSWIGEEVSNDDRYSNANLVEHPYSEWRPGNEKPDPKYHWKAGEGVAEGLKRIVAEQLQLAIRELSADQGATDDAVHEAPNV